MIDDTLMLKPIKYFSRNKVEVIRAVDLSVQPLSWVIAYLMVNWFFQTKFSLFPIFYFTIHTTNLTDK